MRHAGKSILLAILALAALTVAALFAEDSAPLEDGQVGVQYRHKFQTEGGLAPLHWTVKSGQLPPGLQLKQGELTGTPTEALSKPYEFSLQVADSSEPPQTYSQTFKLLVKALPLRIVLGAKPLRILNVSASTAVDPPSAPPVEPPPAAATPAPVVGSGGTASGSGSHPSQPVGTDPPRASAPAPGPAPTPTATPAPNPAAAGNPAAGASPAPAATAPGGGGAQGASAPSDGICTVESKSFCIYQPVDKASAIYGKGGSDENKVSLTVNKKELVKDVIVGKDATFRLPVDPSLKEYDVVKIDLTSSDGTTITIGPLSVTAQVTCGPKSSKLPCINQPHEGDTAITGKVFDGPENAVVPAPEIPVVRVSGESLGSADVDEKAGTFSKIVKPLSQYDTVEADQTKPEGTTGLVSVLEATSAASGQSLYTLGIAGVDITATTSTDPKQQYFAEFKLTGPLGRNDGDPLDSRLWAWFNPRIASVPTTSSSALSSMTSVGTALSGLGEQTLSSITQSLELHGGLEVAVIKPRQGILFGTHQKSSLGLSLIAGLGMVTPFSTATRTQEFDLQPASGGVDAIKLQFDNNQDLQKAYPELNARLQTCTTDTGAVTADKPLCPKQVAFLLPTRSRFYRSYFGGIRLKTFFFEGTCNEKTINAPDVRQRCKPIDVFPGTLDVTVGQDETVTAWRLHKYVMTLSANYPFPGVPWLRVFGAAYLGLSKNRDLPTLALPATQTFVPLNDKSVFVQPVQPADQDYFRIGFGIDIVQAFKSFSGNRPPAGSSEKPK